MLDGKKLTMTMTTCRRLPYFKRAMRSVLDHVLDVSLVDNFILIDDSSSHEDRVEMMELLGTMPMPTEFMYHDQRGLQHSLWTLYRKMHADDTEYVFALEDDWEWVADAEYIRSAYTLIQGLPKVRQVCFTTYTHFDDPANPYGLYKRCFRDLCHNGVRFCRSYIENWTTSPHLMAFREVYSIIGDYPLVPNRHHEMIYRSTYHSNGFEMVFLDEYPIRNIAEVSAYDLNDVTADDKTLKELKSRVKPSCADRGLRLP